MQTGRSLLKEIGIMNNDCATPPALPTIAAMLNPAAGNEAASLADMEAGQ